MRAAVLFLSCLVGSATATAIVRRDYPDLDTATYNADPNDEDNSDSTEDDSHGGDDYAQHWRPKTHSPHFFQILVDDRCDPSANEVPPDDCPFEGYAIRLQHGIVIATPYDRWSDPPLPTFFVDDDTQMYTLSKEPYQFYIDSVTGALQYSKLGWLPSTAISQNFFHTGDNPVDLIDPSSSYVTWPSTYGYSYMGQWLLCEIGQTKQYQVYVNSVNFDPQVVQDPSICKPKALAAINADPWEKQQKGGYNGGHGWPGYPPPPPPPTPTYPH